MKCSEKGQPRKDIPSMLAIPGKDRCLSCPLLSALSSADREASLERSVGFAVVLRLLSTVTRKLLLGLLIPQNNSSQKQTQPILLVFSFASRMLYGIRTLQNHFRIQQCCPLLPIFGRTDGRKLFFDSYTALIFHAALGDVYL